MKPDCVMALNAILGSSEATEVLLYSFKNTELGVELLSVVLTGPKVFGLILWVVFSLLLARI